MTVAGGGGGFRLSDHAWRRRIGLISREEDMPHGPEPLPARNSLTVTTAASLLLSAAAAVGAYRQEWVVTLLAWAALAGLTVVVNVAGLERQHVPRGLRAAGLRAMVMFCYVAWAYVAVAGWIAIIRWLWPILSVTWS